MIGIQISGKQAIDRWIKIIDILQIETCQMVVDPAIFTGAKTRFHYQSIFEQLKKQHHIQKIFLHAPDNSNISGLTRFQRVRCWKTLRHQLQQCENMGVDGLIVHVNLKDPIEKKVLRNEISSIFFDALLKTPLLLENTAYPRDSYGCRLDLLGSLADLLNDWTPTGICLDSAHLFASGYRFDSKEMALNLRNTYPSFFEQVALIHVNDSKEAFESFRDRHEELGKGFIGLGALGALLSLFPQSMPFIMEAPQIPIEDLLHSVEELKILVKSNCRQAESPLVPVSPSWIY
jgi:deoxyribonuclease IV